MKLLLSALYAHAHQLPGSVRILWGALVTLADITTFFTNLYSKLSVISVAIAVFFFAWAALLYMTSGAGNERNKAHALGALYAALGGLALALLAKTIGGIVETAAQGQ
jgi:hypothetical protein